MPVQAILLGVNVDHVATIRQARGTAYPDPIEAALAAEKGGADGITMHLREDRRHIQDRDVEKIQAVLSTRLNFEMGVTEEMLAIAERIRPAHCCFVPEKRAELTTEGGLDVVSNESRIKWAVSRLRAIGCEVSLFIDPEIAQIEATIRTGASVIEIHTGEYAEALAPLKAKDALARIVIAARVAEQAGLIVNAGHGLHYQNVQAIAAIPQMNELNIGHAIVARAMFVGMENAVREMKALMVAAKKESAGYVS